MKFRLFIFIFMTCFSGFVKSQWNLTINSQVEKDGKGLGGAKITVMLGNKVVSETSSESDGDFTLSIPPDGDFTILVSYEDCNPKKFQVITRGVPAEVAGDNFSPKYRIGGFTMKRPLPGIDYSALKNPMVKIVYFPAQGKFDHEPTHTELMLASLERIRNAEKDLIERQAAAVKAGDIALKKNDCALAKTNYELAIKLIPQPPYEDVPKAQLVKCDKCIAEKENAANKEKEAQAQKEMEAKAAAEKAAAEKLAGEKAEQVKKQKEEADRLAREKAAREKEEADRLAREKAEQEKKQKEEADRLAREKAEKEKAEKERLARQKDQEAREKAEAEKLAKEKLEKENEEKARLAREKSEKEEQDRLAREKAESEKKQAEANAIAENERLARLKTEQENAAKSRLAAEQAEKNKAAQNQLAKEKAEKDRKEAEEKKRAADLARSAESREKQEKEKAKAKEVAERLSMKEMSPRKETRSSKSEQERSEPEGIAIKGTAGKTESDKSTGSGKARHSIPQVLGSDKYKPIIARADDYFKMKRYAEAKEAYEEALSVKDGDPHATSRLKQIEKLTAPE